MRNKKIVVIVFALVVLAQLYVPAKMIWNQEYIWETGKEYKFKTAPIDPNDPFRGKYIILRFDSDEVEADSSDHWAYGQEVYITLTTSKGFAQPLYASMDRPTENTDFLKVKVAYPITASKLKIDYPFNRFYMEESKAPKAEKVYRDSRIDSTQIAYGLVAIKDGEAVLKDVFIDGVSIKELAE